MQTHKQARLNALHTPAGGSAGVCNNNAAVSVWNSEREMSADVVDATLRMYNKLFCAKKFK